MFLLILIALREAEVSKQIINSAFLAEQVAGSCRIAGFQVSKDQESMMRQIISGQVDAKKIVRDLVNRYRQTN